MTPKAENYAHSSWRILVFSLVLFFPSSWALNSDGILLLSFKYAILSDPLAALDSWNYDDVTPCSWNGVTCTQLGVPGTPDMFRVTSLILPNSKLLGSIPSEVGQIEHLTLLDLSGNFFNGSLPDSIFNASNLQVLSLSNNVISGQIPEVAAGGMKSLTVLNLSDNALAGNVPGGLSALENLNVISLRGNYFSGSVPGGLSSVQVLDLSSNLFNGSLPPDFGGAGLRYLNLSYNKISGPIPTEFASHIPKNATVDLSFNNLSGPVPESLTWLDQKTEFLAGNVDLCGKPLKMLCSIPSTLSTPPNVSTTSPAIAVIPKPINSSPDTAAPTAGSATATTGEANGQTGGGLKPGTIAGIALGDLAGITLLALVILYVYQLRKKRTLLGSPKKPMFETKTEVVTRQDPESRKPAASTWSCLPIKAEETSDATSSSESDREDKDIPLHEQTNGTNQKVGSLVTVDGETEMELDTLLKASAYILGTSGGSIMYKAVLENGTAYAVRRIGDSSVERLKDFESQVRAIAKLKHPNLVRVRGFYWGDDEKLVIYDYINNGSLANTVYRKAGSSPFHLTFETRLKIARGVARGLAYVHEKKTVHGNIKPSNILLNSDMEPIISDLGLDRLIIGNNSRKIGAGSTRLLGSQRFNAGTRDGPQESPTPYTPTNSAGAGNLSPYQAPESLKNVKPNSKWDVYSFGIVLLELLTGRIFLEQELSQWTTTLALSSGSEDGIRVLRLVDGALRADVAAREEVLMACLKLGFSCACLAPPKRPSMKEALQVLERIP